MTLTFGYWTHPISEERRLYINGLDANAGIKVWVAAKKYNGFVDYEIGTNANYIGQLPSWASEGTAGTSGTAKKIAMLDNIFDKACRDNGIPEKCGIFFDELCVIARGGKYNHQLHKEMAASRRETFLEQQTEVTQISPEPATSPNSNFANNKARRAAVKEFQSAEDAEKLVKLRTKRDTVKSFTWTKYHKAVAELAENVAARSQGKVTARDVQSVFEKNIDENGFVQ